MATTYEIPLSPAPQRFSIQLNGVTYFLSLTYRDAVMGGWILGISDVDEVAIVNGIPLVTGRDLLEPFGYLGIGGALWASTDADPYAVPTFDNLGEASHLYFVVP